MYITRLYKTQLVVQAVFLDLHFLLYTAYWKYE